MITEYFNEIILLLAIYTLVAYTHWIDDLQFRQNVGYITVGIVSLHLVVNLVLIFLASLGSYKGKC